ISVGVRERLDVRAAIAHARTLGAPVVYVGFSMGAVAYLLGDVEADVAVLDAPYDTLDGAIEARTRRFRLGRQWTDAIAREGANVVGVEPASVRPIDRVARLTSPTLFLFARGDAWIGPEVRARFAHVLPDRARIEHVAGSHRWHHHRDYRARVVAFVERSLATIV
ncbi:MAG: hypothetical protein ACHREM_24170, partial [Polyangiales bacterium]